MYGLNERELEIIKEVANRLDIKKILLFGSRAKGNYKKGSDIDLAIVGNERKFSYYLNEETNLPYFFDVVNLEKLDNSILEHIKRVGKDII
jgi:predicted nucleotidyltransferase